MYILSTTPMIKLEEVNETSHIIHFSPAEINTENDAIRTLAGDLYTQSAGAITVHLENLPYGQMVICSNPVLNGALSLDAATKIMSDLLQVMGRPINA